MALKGTIMAKLSLCSLWSLFVGLCMAEMNLVIHSDLRNGVIAPRSVLKFSLFARMGSLAGSEMVKSGQVKFCLLLNANPCVCETSTGRGQIYDTLSDAVMQSYNMILPSSCIPSDEGGGGRLHSFAVEVFVSGREEEESEISTPFYFNYDKVPTDMTTLVLPLTAADMRRSLILFRSLQELPPGVILELLILCPDTETNTVASQLNSFYGIDEESGTGLDFPIHVVSESTVFVAGIPASADKYGLQMTLKLLAAKLVKTPFYLTLDADLVLLKPELVSSILLSEGRVAVFEDESRAVHPEWWRGSASFLGLNLSEGNEGGATLDTTEGAGFGVTPSVLSTFGSLLTVRQVLCGVSQCFPSGSNGSSSGGSRGWKGDTLSSPNEDLAPLERSWLLHFLKPYGSSDVNDDVGGQGKSGRTLEAQEDYTVHRVGALGGCMKEGQTVLWSEYTLYRLVLGQKGIFHALHSPALPPAQAESNAIAAAAAASGSLPSSKIDESISSPPTLHCFDVWFEGDLPWKASLALHSRSRCLFSVIQSSSNANPADIESSLGWT